MVLLSAPGTGGEKLVCYRPGELIGCRANFIQGYFMKLALLFLSFFAAGKKWYESSAGFGSFYKMRLHFVKVSVINLF